jgi:hypothetical protein
MNVAKNVWSPVNRRLETLLWPMARRFQRSPRAIQFHVSNLLSKLGAHSRTELIHVARERGWLD